MAALFEITIIYLALGAPFAVYHVTTHPAEAVWTALWNSSLNVFLWPLYFGHFLYAHFRRPAHPPVAELRSDLENLASNHLEGQDLREFRRTLETYIGIATAAELPIGTSALIGLNEIGVLASPAAASAVARRRNRERLLTHRSLAWLELLNAVSHLPAGHDKALQLAALLNDPAHLSEQPHNRDEHRRASQNIDSSSVSAAA